MSRQRVLLSFARATDCSLRVTAQSVLSRLYTGDGLAAYPAPPVSAVDLESALDAFDSAVTAAAAGGPADTAAKKNQRAGLIELLRQLAGYVQSRHGNDLARLLDSGFEAASTSGAPVSLDAPAIRKIAHGHSGQLILRITRIANTRVYEVRYALVSAEGTSGPWLSGGAHHTNSRALPVADLVPGALYRFQVRAIGGHTGYSDWSEAVSQRSL